MSMQLKSRDAHDMTIRQDGGLAPCLADQIEQMRQSFVNCRADEVSLVNMLARHTLEADGAVMRAIDDLEKAIHERRQQIRARLANLSFALGA